MDEITKLIERLTKASSAVYLATDEAVADDLSSMLREELYTSGKWQKLPERTPSTVSTCRGISVPP